MNVEARSDDEVDSGVGQFPRLIGLNDSFTDVRQDCGFVAVRVITASRRQKSNRVIDARDQLIGIKAFIADGHQKLGYSARASFTATARQAHSTHAIRVATTRGDRQTARLKARRSDGIRTSDGRNDDDAG